MKVNELIKSVGLYIAESIEEDFSTATVYMDATKGSVRYKGEYYKPNGEQKDIRKFPLLIGPDIHELYTIMSKSGMSKWNRATATLTSAGEFEMKFEWDQEYFDEIERLAKE